EGAAHAAASVGARVLGGDLVRSPRYLIDVCVLGTTRRPVRRKGARARDSLWVTGQLGGSGRALDAFKNGRPPAGELRERFAHPEARIAAGQWLARHGARAMIDISDGLVADAGHVAAASSVAIDLELENIPCWPGVPPLDAAASGEEYELLVALPSTFPPRARRDFSRVHALPLTRIGRCRTGVGVRLLDQGRAVEHPPRGFSHFGVA